MRDLCMSCAVKMSYICFGKTANPCSNCNYLARQAYLSEPYQSSQTTVNVSGLRHSLTHDDPELQLRKRIADSIKTRFFGSRQPGELVMFYQDALQAVWETE